jgi:hypothetical protein
VDDFLKQSVHLRPAGAEFCGILNVARRLSLACPEIPGDSKMRQVLFSVVAIGAMSLMLAGCATDTQQSVQHARIESHSVNPNLVMRGGDADSPAIAFTNESPLDEVSFSRNDPLCTRRRPPEFATDRWMTIRQYDFQRTTNGRPHEDSTTNTYSVTTGPGR